MTHLYLINDGEVGILGDWGVGAPGLAIKMEELVALEAKRFIAVGTAGGLMGAHEISDFILCQKALAEDGVAHLYLANNTRVAHANPELTYEWGRFAKDRQLPQFFWEGFYWKHTGIPVCLKLKHTGTWVGTVALFALNS